MSDEEKFEVLRDNLELAVREVTEALPVSHVEKLKEAHDLAEEKGDFHAEHMAVRQFLNDFSAIKERMRMGPRLIAAELNNILLTIEKHEHKGAREVQHETELGG